MLNDLQKKCDRAGKESVYEILDFLIEAKIINVHRLRDYLIINDYPTYLRNADMVCGRAVSDMAEYFGVSERTINRKIYDQRERLIGLMRLLP